jgi:hypothetical protein
MEVEISSPIRWKSFAIDAKLVISKNALTEGLNEVELAMPLMNAARQARAEPRNEVRLRLLAESMASVNKPDPIGVIVIFASLLRYYARTTTISSTNP